MDYNETVNYLFNIAPLFEKVGAKAYKTGLDNTLALDRHFNHPHQNFKSIHIAGTNGKGSCSHTLASVLQREGYKVGLYTSPHLVDFRERIRINGECISKHYIIDFVEKEKNFFEKLHPSFFEVTTALAFKYFADNNIDIAVIEVGLGGRLDCTNIIMPEMSIITNISFDHTQFLGNTLGKIASEKAGIIKQGIPVVIGETTPETKNVFKKKAKEENAPIIFAEEHEEIISSYFSNSQIICETVHFGTIRYEMGGNYQTKNINTILNAIIVLMKNGLISNIGNIKYGLAHVCEETGLNGRWQEIRKSPRTICDTGHNLGGWKYLSKQITSQPYNTLRIVFGMVDDKDIDNVLKLLPRENTYYYFVRASTKRAIPEDVIMHKATRLGLEGEAFDKVVSG